MRDVARERGFTAAELARRLGLHRSNLSAMDAGTRSVSLQALGRLSKALACSPGELLELTWGAGGPVFRQAALNRRLEAREAGAADGSERRWAHAALLAWQRHYRDRVRR